jgi:hypothetical protein
MNPGKYTSDALIHLPSPLDRHDVQQSRLIIYSQDDAPAADTGLPQASLGW